MILDSLGPAERAALERLRAEVFPGHSAEAVAVKLLRDALIGAGVLPLGRANRSRWARTASKR